MDTYHHNLFFVFFVLFAIVIIDPNVGRLLDLVIKFAGIQIQKIKWILFNDPKNPIVKYFIWRRSLKTANELLKEFNKEE